MKVLKFIAVASLGILMASCCACRKTSSVSALSLTNTKWELTQLEGANFQANDNFYITLGSDNRISGRGDCNMVNGSYALSGRNTVKFSQMASTRAFCANQDQEDKFMRLLGDVDAYRLDGDLLMLFSNGELKMVFQAV